MVISEYSYKTLKKALEKERRKMLGFGMLRQFSELTKTLMWLDEEYSQNKESEVEK